MGETYVVNTQVQLDRDLPDVGRVVMTVEPGDFAPKTDTERAVAAFLVKQGYATRAERKPAKSEMEG